MPRKFRRLNIAIALMFLIQAVIYPASALGSQIWSSAEKTLALKPKITAEQAAQKVKSYFTVPEAYKTMDTGFNEYNNRLTYSLNWNAQDQPGGSFHAEVDAQTGDILNVYQWEEPYDSSFSLPLLSQAEAEKIATDLVSKLAGQDQSELQLVKDQQQLYSLGSTQPFCFNFNWVRVVNGIQFPGNGVNVSVSGEDGKIINYNYNWTDDLVFPAAAGVISPEKARQVFTETPLVQLQYYLTPIVDSQSQEPRRALLVYQADNRGGAIDALSGKPLASSTSSEPSANPGEQAVSASSGISGEQKQISRDEAVKALKEVVDIPADLTLRSSSLNQDWQNPGEKVWDLFWDAAAGIMGGRQENLHARVDAETGDVVDFDIYGASSANTSARLDREGAQKLAEDFLKRVQSERFKLVRMDSETQYIGNVPANIQTFNYQRLVNGLPVSGNGIYITVDTAAKRIINFTLNWSNADFSGLSGVLPLDQATELFLKERPLALNYYLYSQPDGQQEVRLVYQPRSNGSMYTTAMLDAQSGESLNWYGMSQAQWIQPHSFTDIQGNFAEKEISVMGLTGAFGEYGESFRPDEKVTVGTLLRAMILVDGDNQAQARVLSDNEILKMAEERGWLEQDLDLKSELRRDDLAKIMIRLLKMDSAAQIKGIYAVPFTDAAEIEPDSLGYIALAWGLGILKVDDNTLKLSQTVTRAEAAYALVHAFAAESAKKQAS